MPRLAPDDEAHSRAARRAVVVLEALAWLVVCGFGALVAYAIHGWLGAP